MVKKIIGFLGREIKGLHEAAYLLAVFSLLSQFLGLIRDRLLASTFGASSVVDLYYASFRIPDLMFVVVTGLVSASVLVPLLSHHLQDQKELKKIIDSLFSIFIVASLIIILIVFVFAEPLLKVFIPGIASGSNFSDLILFTRILLLSPFLLGVSQLFGGIVQAYRKFFIYAISPILYNAGIIVGIVFFYPIFGVVGLIYGVVLGLILHVIIQLPTVSKHNLIPRLTLDVDWKIVKKVVLLSMPRTVTLASTQITLMFLIAIASILPEGSIAIFNFAFNLQSVPLTIIGVSYSLAAFPTLSRLFVNGQKQEFLSHLITASRHIIFWSFPIIVMFIVLRAQIIRTILGAGAFDWSDTRLTAAALALFAISVIAQSLILLFVRGYYSTGQTRKPLLINVSSMVLTIILSFVLVDYYVSNTGFQIFFNNLMRVDNVAGSAVLMLPLAFSIGTIFNSILLWISFEKSFRGFSKTLGIVFRQSLIASVVAGYVSYLLLQVFVRVFDINTTIGVFSQGFFAGIIGLSVGVAILKLMKNNEIEEVWKTLHHKIWKAKPIAQGQEEL
jgi:putative peptidoglycan lipid II flippase